MAEAETNASSDWRDERNLPECMLYMLENSIMCDVTFRIGKGKNEIHAHKYMLSSRSPVFYTMFQGSLPETREIAIPDIDTATFQILLRYIYSDKIYITTENVEGIVYAAEKYMLASLKRQCENFLIDTATTEHATKAFQIARAYNLSDLKQRSLNYIESNTILCLSSVHALELTKEGLDEILQSDFLDITETDICSFVLNWAKHKCKAVNLEPTGKNLRDVAGKMMYSIRFPVVDMKYFSNEVEKSGLISHEDVIAIYQSHFGEKNIFCNKPRGPIEKRTIHTLSRYSSIANPWSNGEIEALCFVTDTDIWIKGVTIFYPVIQNQNQINVRSAYCNCSVVIEVLDNTNQKVNSCSVPNYCGYTNNVSENQVLFQRATLITAGHKYTLKMTGLTVQTYFGQACKDSVTENGVTITFENSPLCTCGTTTETGQFGGILFSV